MELHDEFRDREAGKKRQRRGDSKKDRDLVPMTQRPTDKIVTRPAIKRILAKKGNRFQEGEQDAVIEKGERRKLRGTSRRVESFRNRREIKG